MVQIIIITIRGITARGCSIPDLGEGVSLAVGSVLAADGDSADGARHLIRTTNAEVLDWAIAAGATPVTAAPVLVMADMAWQ